MSNYSSVNYNIHLSPETPQGIFDFINLSQQLECRKAANLKSVKDVPRLKAFIGTHRWDDLFSNQGNHHDCEIDINTRPVLSKDNLWLSIPVSNQYASSNIGTFLTMLSPYITNKDEVLVYIRDECDSENGTEGRLYYLDRGNNVSNIVVQFEDYGTYDFVEALKTPHSDLLKLKKVRGLKRYYPNNPFG